MTLAVGAIGPRWVWVREVAAVVDRHLDASGMSLGEFARLAHERYGLGTESVERRLRAARGSDGVMGVHTADRYLVLVGGHLTDLPSYREAMDGRIPAEQWPRRRR